MRLSIFKPKYKSGYIRIYIPDDNKLWKKFSRNAVNELRLLNLPYFGISTLEIAYIHNIKELEYIYAYNLPLAYLVYNYKIKRLIRKWNNQGIKTVLMWEV